MPPATLRKRGRGISSPVARAPVWGGKVWMEAARRSLTAVAGLALSFAGDWLGAWMKREGSPQAARVVPRRLTAAEVQLRVQLVEWVVAAPSSVASAREFADALASHPEAALLVARVGAQRSAQAARAAELVAALLADDQA